MKVNLSTYPESLVPYPGKSIELIIEVESSRENPTWMEAEITLEAGLTLKEHSSVSSGRFRVGICEGRSACSKTVKIYASHNVRSHLYKCHVSVFAFNAKGDSAGRVDEHTLIKCSSK